MCHQPRASKSLRKSPHPTRNTISETRNPTSPLQLVISTTLGRAPACSNRERNSGFPRTARLQTRRDHILNPTHRLGVFLLLPRWRRLAVKFSSQLTTSRRPHHGRPLIPSTMSSGRYRQITRHHRGKRVHSLAHQDRVLKGERRAGDEKMNETGTRSCFNQRSRGTKTSMGPLHLGEMLV